MIELKDIFKHLFYSAWLLLVFEMLRILITFINIHFSIMLVIDVGFNFVLLLFAVGIIRLGINFHEIKFWKKLSIGLIIAASVEIISNILVYSFPETNEYSPLIYIRLVLLIINLGSISYGFYESTRLTDEILEIYEISGRKSKLYLPLGFVSLLYPYIVSWTTLFIYPKPLNNIIVYTAIFVFLTASFFIVLGLIELSFIFKIILEKIKQEKSRTDEDIKIIEEGN